MNKWLQDICKVLRTSRTYQIHGDLINFIAGPNSKIIGKCAMGELGCKIGFKPMELYNMSTHNYVKILKKYKVPLWLRKKNLPVIKGSIGEIGILCNPLDYVIEESYGRTLAEYIYDLNDSYSMNFKQIADLLEVTFEDA